MKKIFLLIFALVILNYCAQSTSLVGQLIQWLNLEVFYKQVILLQHLMDSKA